MSKKITSKFELQTGDVIERRNGNVEIFIKELDVFICTPTGINGFHTLRNDLVARDRKDEQWDIDKVYRPENAAQCSFGDIHRFGELIFNRYEAPVEMTMEEICKVIGKNVKIVK